MEVTRPNDPNTTVSTAAPANGHRALLTPRPKTFGEHVFDISAYGGFALLLNEGLGIWFTGLTKNEPWIAPFAKLRGLTEKLPLVNRFKYVKEGRLAYLLVAFLGGTIAAVPVLFAEFKKSPIVKYINELHYGKDKVAHDPALIEAQKEMEEAPPQTAGSIAKGRLVTMGTAIFIDSTIGCPNAISSQLIEKTRLKNSWINNASSMERACVTAVRGLMNWFDPKGKTARLAARSAEKPFDLQKAEGEATNLLGRGSSLMTLSLALTIIFYVSSKIFANRDEIRRERKLERRGLVDANRKIYAADAALETPAQEYIEPKDNPQEKPSLRVGEVTPHARVATATHAVQAGGMP